MTAVVTARSERRGTAAVIALLGALAYLPALWTAPGVVAADTKQYLYLDPGRYLAGVTSLWDPDQFGGWVTHQTIGYLWPMGPFHWVLNTLGVPVWVAQRLWLGTLLFLAGTGVWWCARVLGLSRPGATAAAVLYQLSPYVLLYAPRTSVILLPWAGLGWVLGLTVLAARRGGWRYPAAAALVVATMAGTNVTAVALVGLGPVLWLVWAIWGSREVGARAALGAAGRIALLSLGTCAAWIVAIVVQARYGADVLAYSETLSAVSSTSLASEVARGLGYWLFYGGDVTGPWNSASDPYLSAPALIGLGLVLATVGVAAAVLVRWANRGFVALLLLVGAVVSVGAHPLSNPSLYGRLLSGSARSTIVLALRSSTRALPLVVLGLALAVGAGVAALGLRLPATARLAAGAVVVLAALNLPALWNGTYVDGLQRRPSAIPAAWGEAAAAASAPGALAGGTRLLELPGAEFAAYRWGTTNDAILPGLTDRPTLTRDLLPLGSPGLMDLLLALDDRFQTGTVEGPEVAPVARLLAASGIVVRGDSAFERFRTPRPEITEALYAGTPEGLGAPASFGPPAPNHAAVAGLDEWALGVPEVGTPVAPVQLVPVEDAPPVVRARGALAPVVVDGNGEGIVAAAAAGVLDGRRPVLQAASLDATALAAEAGRPGATLVVTDTNRERARQWRGSQDTTGFTEDGHDGVLRADDADARLPVFPGTGPGSRTVAEQRGGVTVRATSYGEPNAYRPEDRPALAMDGDPSTAWLVGDRGEVLGERLRLAFDAPRPVTSIEVRQPQDHAANRWITELTVRTEQGSVTVPLGEASRTGAGERIVLPEGVAGRTAWVELEVAATNVGRRSSYFGVGPVGFAEVGLDGLRVDEVVVLPTDLLRAAGSTSAAHDLAVVLTRQRHDPHDRWRDDEERAMVRELALPAERVFDLTGTARLSARATDVVLASLLTRSGAGGGLQATASTRLGGTPAAWGRAAVDGDPASAWTSAFGSAAGASLTLRPSAPVTIDSLSVAAVDDGRHSVPTSLLLRNEAGEERVVALPEAGGGEQRVAFTPLTASTLTVTVDAAEERTTVDRRSGETVVLPTAISSLSLGAGDLAAEPLPSRFDTGCREDLVAVDGVAVPVRIHGTTADLVARRPLPLERCPDGAGLSLSQGTHQVRTAAGLATGLDLDRLVLRSGGGGGASSAGGGSAGPTAVPPDPRVEVTGQSRTSFAGTVTPSPGGGPFWLILGQGLNEGWRASLAGRDLGPPQAVDGGMNGWLVDDPGAAGSSEPLPFTMTWTPQRWVTASLVVAAVSVLACVVLLVVPLLRRSRRREAFQAPEAPIGERSRACNAGAPYGAESVPNRRLTYPQPEFVGVRGAAPGQPWRASILAALAVGAVTAAVLPPWYALVTLPVALVAARLPAWRRLAAVGAVTSVGLVAAFYVVRQVVSAPAPGFGWPSAFEQAHDLALLGFVLVAADALLAAMRARQAVHYPAPQSPTPEPR